jgi:TetR/AcrR family tetracycline transcriptional repressor
MSKGDEKTKRGAGLSREKILEAAVGVVDAEGLDALTMRRLAEELGVEAMSLYRYVESKDDLLDGLHATILAELEVPDLKGPWREVLRELARAFRRTLAAHPKALLLFATRPAVAPGAVEHVERAVQLLVDAGFGRDAIHAFQTGFTFVVGQALWRGPEDEFEYGLDALLLGLEAKLRRRK